MRKIFKYQIRVEDEATLCVPGDFVLIHIGEQHGAIVAWCVVEVDDAGLASIRSVDRGLCIRGTGQPFKGNEGKHISTVQMSNGLVWHIFWRL